MSENQILDLLQQYGSLQKAMSQMPDVELTLSNGKAYVQQGKIDAISGTVDESTGAISLRASFSNPDGLLRNGGSGTVLIPTVRKIVSLFLRRPLMSYKIGYSFTKLLKERRNLLRSRYLN